MNLSMTNLSLRDRKRLLVSLTVLAVLLGVVAPVVVKGVSGNPSPDALKPAVSKPALTVSPTMPQVLEWPRTLPANGNVAAWQEAVIGAEIANYRITEVRANVGDKVSKGQVLARIAGETVATELAEARASVAELEAMLNEAKANSERARQLRDRGFFSPQQATQSLTAEQTALARLNAARARLEAAELRMAKTSIVAPDDGIVSARSATVGSLTQPGQELFRLIRGGRLEWRAEVTATELEQLKPGVSANLINPNGERVSGVVRTVAPTIDPQNRNALVYVDIPASGAVRAGMFARGEFEFGRGPALTLPQSAVLLREGFAYVFRIDSEGESSKVTQTKVAIGRRSGDRLEILGGIDAGSRVVASGAGFLADGDTVKVVAANGVVAK